MRAVAVILLACIVCTFGRDTHTKRQQRYQLPKVQYPRETDPTKQTALDKFALAYDPTAGYAVYPKVYQGNGWKGYVLDFDSGLWKPEVSSLPLWQHWLTVCVPDVITQNVATMYMDGPSNTEVPDENLNPVMYMFCNGGTQAPSVYLQQVPNEDISFPDHPGGLGEDGLIAYTWRKFLNGSATDPTWLLRLPMTRAGINAMTAVQDFMSRYFPQKIQPEKFLLAGASKRGWNTWTVSAVDSRVVVAVPIVMPIPDVVVNIAAEWRAYGNWSFALKDYVNFDITKYLFASPVGVQAIADIVGPMPYISRYTFPVWNIMACGDEFTLPDSPRFWWNKLPGEKHLRIIPNAEHSMATALLDVISDVLAFYTIYTQNIPRPVVNWNLVHSATKTGLATITVSASITPKTVNMWYASTMPSTGLRDFRLVVCFDIPRCVQPVLWFPQALKPIAPNTWQAQQSPPAVGWTGFLVQLDFEIPVANNKTAWWRVSTEVNIVPDVFPFASCPQSECNNPPKIAQ